MKKGIIVRVVMFFSVLLTLEGGSVPLSASDARVHSDAQVDLSARAHRLFERTGWSGLLSPNRVVMLEMAWKKDLFYAESPLEWCEAENYFSDGKEAKRHAFCAITNLAKFLLEPENFRFMPLATLKEGADKKMQESSVGLSDDTCRRRFYRQFICHVASCFEGGLKAMKSSDPASPEDPSGAAPRRCFDEMLEDLDQTHTTETLGRSGLRKVHDLWGGLFPDGETIVEFYVTPEGKAYCESVISKDIHQIQRKTALHCALLSYTLDDRLARYFVTKVVKNLLNEYAILGLSCPKKPRLIRWLGTAYCLSIANGRSTFKLGATLETELSSEIAFCLDREGINSDPTLRAVGCFLSPTPGAGGARGSSFDG